MRKSCKLSKPSLANFSADFGPTPGRTVKGWCKFIIPLSVLILYGAKITDKGKSKLEHYGLLKPVDKASLTSGMAFSGIRAVKPAYISEIELIEADRYTTGMPEFDRVLGGGIVGGSLVLLGGDPGIGKFTILLQMCINLAKSGRRVLYISGEESLKQIKQRSERQERC